MGEQAAAAMTFTDRTLEFVKKTKLNAETIKWFIDGQLEEYTDVALGAETGADAIENFAKPMIAKGFIKADVPGHSVAIKKFWVMCHDQYTLDRAPGAGQSSDVEAVIPRQEETSNKSRWTDKHYLTKFARQILRS